MGIVSERVTDAITVHGEGPLWTDRTWVPFDEEGFGAHGVLRLVDMVSGELLAHDPDTGRTTRRRVGSFAACVRPRRDGGLAMALRDSFALLDPGASEFRDLGPVWDDASLRFNDGGCDPAGRFYCGSMADEDGAGRGAMHRLDPDGSVSAVAAGLTIPNGLVCTADGTRAYHIDSATRRIDVVELDPASGGWGARRPFVTFEDGAGDPDGMCLDAEGGIWVAMWAGSAVRRYDASGVLDAVVPLPVSFPTCPGFGGPDRDQLYVTSSRRDVPPGEEPEAGAVFRIDPGITGAPVLPYAG